MRPFIIRALIVLAFIYFTPLGGLVRPFFTSKSHWFEGIPIKSIGTGFYVNESDVVTNQHVIAWCERIVVGGTDKRVTDAKVIAVDPQNDIAILETSNRVAAVLYFSNPRAADAGDEAVYPDYTSEQGRFSLEYLTIKQRDSDNIYASLGIRGGNSGAPLMDEYGRVIGVNKGSIGKGWLGFLGLTGYTLAVNGVRLTGFLESKNIPFTMIISNPAQRLKDPAYRDYIAVNIGCIKSTPWFMP